MGYWKYAKTRNVKYLISRRILLSLSVALAFTVAMLCCELVLVHNKNTNTNKLVSKLLAKEIEWLPTQTDEHTAGYSVSNQSVTSVRARKTRIKIASTRMPASTIVESPDNSGVNCRQPTDNRSNNNGTEVESLSRPGVRVQHSESLRRSPSDSVCRLYEHLDLPASNESGPQYTYRYRDVRVIRTPDAKYLCDNNTRVFAAINSGLLYFDRRRAVCYVMCTRTPNAKFRLFSIGKLLYNAVPIIDRFV